MGDLVERLKKMVYIDYALMDEAASEILRLQEENAHHANLISELVGAMEPFGNSDMRFMPELNYCESENSCVGGTADFTYGDLLKANEVLARVKEAGL